MKSIAVTSQQFQGSDPISANLRRLVQNLIACENAVNALISQAQEGTVAPHVLATITGLGPDHTVSGLTEGEVLKALSATSAAFAQLQLSDLAAFDLSDLSDGQVLQYLNGAWTNVPTTAITSGVTGESLGSGSAVYVDTVGAVLAFKSLVQGVGLSVSASPTTVTLSLGKAAAVTAYLNPFTASLKGLVPAPGQLAGRVLSDSGWVALPSGPTYTFIQSAPAAVWNVTHNLERYPSVDVADSTGELVVGDVRYIDSNHITLTFSAPFSGEAYLN